jgi:hypothetical protein
VWRARVAVAAQLGERFLRHYQTLTAVSAERVALWEAAHLFTYVLHGWTSVRPHRLKATCWLLTQHLQATGLAG